MSALLDDLKRFASEEGELPPQSAPPISIRMEHANATIPVYLLWNGRFWAEYDGIPYVRDRYADLKDNLEEVILKDIPAIWFHFTQHDGINYRNGIASGFDRNGNIRVLWQGAAEVDLITENFAFLPLSESECLEYAKIRDRITRWEKRKAAFEETHQVNLRASVR